jgi:hypothetical protein
MPALERETRIAESVHLLSFLSSFLLITYALYKGWLDSAAWLMLYNILINIYPQSQRSIVDPKWVVSHNGVSGELHAL